MPRTRASSNPFSGRGSPVARNPASAASVDRQEGLQVRSLEPRVDVLEIGDDVSEEPVGQAQGILLERNGLDHRPENDRRPVAGRVLGHAGEEMSRARPEKGRKRPGKMFFPGRKSGEKALSDPDPDDRGFLVHRAGDDARASRVDIVRPAEDVHPGGAGVEDHLSFHDGGVPAVPGAVLLAEIRRRISPSASPAGSGRRESVLDVSRQRRGESFGKDLDGPAGLHGFHPDFGQTAFRVTHPKRELAA